VVTLTDEMKAVLGPHRGHGSVFNGGASKQTLLNVLEAHGVDATNHGFRSSCKDYLRGPLVKAPLDLAELALGHKRRGVESAYGDRVPGSGVARGGSPRSPALAGLVSWRLPEG